MKKFFTSFALLFAAVCSWGATVPTPANPSITSYQRRGFMYEVILDIPAADVSGKALDKANLSYRLYVDGNPFTFTKSEYTNIESDMTEIPWDYQDANGSGYDIMKWVNGDGSRRIFLYSQPSSSVGVESIYTTADGQAVSGKYVYDISTGNGHIEGEETSDKDVITQLPQDARALPYTLDTWMMSGIQLQHYTWSGRFDDLGFLGDNVYFKDICGEYRFGTYVKGTIINNGTTLRIEMNQHIFHQDEEQGYEKADVYLKALRLNEAGDDIEVIDDQEYVDFTISEDGVISLSSDKGLAYVGDDGHLLAKNLGYTYKPFDILNSTVTPPAGCAVNEYNLTFSNETDGNRNSKTGLKVVFDNVANTVYVQGLTKTMDGWVKGTIEGDKVVFPSAQYIGTYTNSQNDQFAVYFNGAYDTGEYDLFGRVYATKENITFDYDKKARTLKSQDCITETIGSVNPLSHIVAPELLPVGEVAFEPATPANPTIKSWRSRGFQYELIAEIPSVDVDGNPIDTDALVYRFFINDNQEPFTFSKGTYNYIKEDMVDIPWNYQDQQGYGYDIMKWDGEDSRRIYFYEKPSTIAVETSYTVNGETRNSLRHVYNVATGESEYIDPSKVSVETLSGEKNVLDVTYTDMSGAAISRPDKGLYIKTTRFTDGTVKNEKVMR